MPEMSIFSPGMPESSKSLLLILARSICFLPPKEHTGAVKDSDSKSSENLLTEIRVCKALYT